MKARRYGHSVAVFGAGLLLLRSEAAPAQAGSAYNPTAEAQPGSEASSSRLLTSGELEPIIVTARRRQERLQHTPLSVISLSGKELESRSVTNLRTLQNFVPNLTFAPSQNVGDAAGNMFIRGIGQEDFVAGAEPGVGFYLDGIYVARTMGTLINLIDIERVEVLRGPQGTLYGKNAIGGTINVISVAPSPAAEAYAELMVGELGRLELKGMVNAPLTETLFIRLASGRFERKGYLRRLTAPFPPTSFTGTNHAAEGSDDDVTGRMQLRWLASPSLTIDLAADASRRRGTQSATHIDAIDPSFGILPRVNSLIRQGRLPGPEITDALATDNLLTSFAGGSNSIAQDAAGASVTVSNELAGHRLKLITAYRRLRSHVSNDLDGTWFPILQGDFAEWHHQYSAELQAGGAIGPLTYTTGMVALDERMRTRSLRGVGRVDILYVCGCFYPPQARPILFFPQRRQSGHSYAAYAQASLRLSDRLSAILGGRLSHEWKSTKVELIQLDQDTLEVTPIVLRSGRNRASWNSFTWRAGLDFQAGPDLMLYVSASKGFKSGGFNTRPIVNLPNLGVNEFSPETALTYEAGIRSEWFGRRLRLNATVFNTDYRDIQLRQQTFVNGILTTLIENAARARVRGVEVEAAAKLTSRVTVNLAYGNLDPQFRDVGTVPGLTLDSNFQRTPRHSFTASMGYSVRLGGHLLSFHGDYSYRSREQFQLTSSPFDQPGYGLLGARVTLRGSADRWRIALFGTNLTDERYRVAGRASGLTEVGFATSIIGLPRQVGVEFRAGF